MLERLEQVIVQVQYSSVLYVTENNFLENTIASTNSDDMNYFRSRFLNRDSKANIGSLYDSDRALRSVNTKCKLYTSNFFSKACRSIIYTQLLELGGCLKINSFTMHSDLSKKIYHITHVA